MNSEYIWSKTGNDPEVERLESLLGEFRFDENTGAHTPATNVIPVTSSSNRRWFFGLSLAATAAALVLMSIWFTKPPVAAVASHERDAAPVQETDRSRKDVDADLRTADLGNSVVPTADTHPQAEPMARHLRSRVDRTVHTVATKKKEALTKEEKYAYDRLMLALAITGSKLKMVQDSVDRKHDSNPQTTRNEK